MLIEIPDQFVRSLFSRPVAYFPQDPKINTDDRVPENHGPLLHAAVGLAGESGELLDCIKKAWAYGQPLDEKHATEELGDLLFYWIAACQELGVHPQTVIDQNLAKLRKRFPSGKFTPADAAERKDKK